MDEGDIWVLLAFFGGFGVLLAVLGAFLYGPFTTPRPTRLVNAILRGSGLLTAAIFTFAVVTQIQKASLVEGVRIAFAGFSAQLPDERDESGAYVTAKVVVVNRRGYDMLNSSDWREVDPGKVADLHFSLPGELRASTPDEVRTVVWLDCDPDDVGTYDSGTDALKFTCRVTVVDHSRGIIVGSTSFEGGDPPDSISCNSCPDEISGSLPFDDVLGYLTGLPRR